MKELKFRCLRAEDGIEVKAKIKEHKLTVMCSDGKFDMLLSWLDREGYFFMTED